MAKFGLEAALSDLKDSIEHSNKIAIEIDFHEMPEKLPGAMEIDLYRIVQELISNSIKHGQARKIWIQFLLDGDLIRFMYEEDGNGFDIRNKAGGIGLRNIHARSQKYAAEVSIDSTPGNGMRAMIELNINADEKVAAG